MPADTVDILGLTSDDLTAAARPHAPTPEAIAGYRAVFRQGAEPPSWASLPDMPVAWTEREGAVCKFVQRLPGGLETETMILPQHGRTGRTRTTLCVSSQVGCAMGCTFCETAQMGRMRDLTAAEIVAQWRAARFDLGADVDNVVFMGMGEPLDNLDAVLRAVEVLADRNGPAVPVSRISISTIGRADGLARLDTFAQRPGFRQLRLAVSLNAPDDAIRSRLMPVNRTTPMAALRQALERWSAVEPRRVLIGYVLIPGVNDHPDHATAVAAYLRGLPATVNVIPYNPRRDSPWPAPAEGDVARFVDLLRAGGLFVTRRRTMGRSLMGACGQLGNPGIRRRRLVAPAS